MSGNKKNVPKRRFKEFENAEGWEQRELGKLTDVYDGTHQTPNYTDSGVMFLSVENIKTLQSEKFISEEDFEKDFAIYPEKGDVLMTRIGDIGTANVVESDAPKAYYVSLALLKQKELNSYFLKESISSKAVKKELWKRTLHIAFPKKINKNEIANVIVPYPISEGEQQRIGELFQSFNNLITLHQRKLDKMKALKEAYLTEMFPAEGERKPKRRFAGFTDDWEQYKLGDLGDVVMNRRIFKEQTSDEGDVPFYKIGTFGSEPDAFISRNLFEEYKSKYPYPEKGDILISASGSIGRTVEYMGKDEYFQDSNIVWLKHDNRIINSFLKQFYSIVKWSGLEGSTIKRLYNKNILDTPILLPKPEEQKKIGQFFIELDNLITLHQRKLEKLQNIKKAYLNEMFI